MKSKLADALKELQKNTIEMERNRVIPELIGLYNCENEVHDLLPDYETQYFTKLIGIDNKRVITEFNPSNPIQFNTLNGPDDSVGKKNHILPIAGSSNERENLEEPLQWDRNWMWDY